MLLSPAKLNLRLIIKGIRKDGYHLLDSYFVPISLFDEITIEELPANSKTDQIQFRFGAKSKTIKNNTVEKSLLAFRKRVPHLPYLNIKIEKNIPIGAGLGGGSSNAGSIMAYLHKKYASNLTVEELTNVASHIGADVPFFITSKASWVSGIGEIIELAPLPQTYYFLVIKPPFSVSTKEAYGWYDAQRSLTHDVSGASSNGRPQLGLSFLNGFLQNDLESAVVENRPEIEVIKKALLKQGSLGAMMTGSGSAVFGIFKDEASAQSADIALKQDLKQHSFFITKSIN